MTALDVVQPNSWDANSGLFLNPYPYSYFYSSNVMPSLSNQNLKQKTLKQTEKPSKKFPEPTTKPPSTSNKLTSKSSNGLKNDGRLIAAVQKVNPTFEIENIVPIPGTPYYQIASVEKFPLKKSKPKASDSEYFGDIKVEATGKTSAGNSVPDISFGSYFLPYNSNVQSSDRKTASLILQPSSKAIVGNGGTAISAPISRAVLKKGVPTNVFFNPESVAIAGAGGRAHAQADLILDIIE
ncbi:uncharacterized protein LOC129909395 [Episyrphus balteatus]|uniref:uncharacterized protein LOC129909395 n=1 Tax=Episyrphus balteatus TaxID=286459 RepID=UPI002485E474|nr:uncharacterized protein LOC129909395 [Episyrphus balteatus]